MTSKTLNLRHGTSQHLERTRRKLAYVLLERDLFRLHGPSAVWRLTDDDRRQLARLGHDIRWKHLFKIAVIASLRTIRRWYRLLIEQHDKPKRRGGRKRTSLDTEQEVVRLALENDWGSDSWGSERIVGEIRKLGVTIVKSTVSAILRRHGIPPAPKRGRMSDDERFLIHDPATTAAIDFAKVLIIDKGIICLMSVLIAIHLKSREIQIVNVAHDPDGSITEQCAKNLTMADVGFFHRLGILTVIMDRDPIYTQKFREILAAAGCMPHRITPYSPWENGYAEWFIRSLKESLLRKAIFTSESAVRIALAEFQQYFNEERPHQGIGNNTVKSRADRPSAGEVIRIPRVGGLLNHYVRAA